MLFKLKKTCRFLEIKWQNVEYNLVQKKILLGQRFSTKTRAQAHVEPSQMDGGSGMHAQEAFPSPKPFN